MGRPAETGQGHVSDVLKGRYYRLEVDQFLGGGSRSGEGAADRRVQSQSGTPTAGPLSPTPLSSTEPDGLLLSERLGVSPSESSRRRCCALRSDVHEEASVKIGARRCRDFPDIHPASSAKAERHARGFGRSHSLPRRCNAPRRTSGCD
jgi:hypothetical protein